MAPGSAPAPRRREPGAEVFPANTFAPRWQPTQTSGTPTPSSLPFASTGATATAPAGAVSREPGIARLACGHVRPALTVMTYNIHQGRGVDGVFDLDRIAAVIRSQDADLVALQEVGRHWSAESEFRDQPAELARLLEMEWVYGANLDRDPPAPGAPRRQYGTAILTAWPIRGSENIPLPRVSADNEQRGLLVLDVDLDGAPFRLHNAHLSVSAQDRRLQVEALLAAADSAAVPHALAGDLNAAPQAPELAPLFDRFRDAWTVGGEGDGFTFPASAPTVRIDYVLVSPELGVGSVDVPARAGSDHLPLVAELAAAA